MPKYWNHTLFWLALCLRPAPNNIVIAYSRIIFPHPTGWCDGCATCRWGDECNHWIQVETRAPSTGMITTPLAPSHYQYILESLNILTLLPILQLSQFMDYGSLVTKSLIKSSPHVIGTFHRPCRQPVDKCHNCRSRQLAQVCTPKGKPL